MEGSHRTQEVWKRKPKRWVERIQIRCRDEFHFHLMNKYGFEAYCKNAVWSQVTVDDLADWIEFKTMEEFLLKPRETKNI